MLGKEADLTPKVKTTNKRNLFSYVKDEVHKQAGLSKTKPKKKSTTFERKRKQQKKINKLMNTGKYSVREARDIAEYHRGAEAHKKKTRKKAFKAFTQKITT